ncbi:MAG TPA: phenylacetate--CoA ligase [Armatimonadota bacterium]|nr:phenylacetate--CoA ligase [Armatimonadota bacterium]
MSTDMPIWDQRTETLDRDALRQLQLERLQASLFRAYRNVAFYRKRFDALGLAPEDVETLEEVPTLPFTTKDDLRSGYPYDMLAVPLREVVRLQSASYARPTVCAFTRNDLRHWNELAARLLSAGGVTRDDVVQIFFGQSTLVWSLSFHGGAERLGASVIPTPPVDIAQQLALMQDFKSTALVGTASEAIYLAAVVAEKKLDPRRLSVRVGLFGAEPWSETMRAHLEGTLDITALDVYGIAELGGPGIAGECPVKQGLHLAEDHFFVEIIDPASGKALPEGEEGEIVLTTLTKEALPLLRFRTCDLGRLDAAPCACGRTHARLSRITRRTDGSFIVQGRKLHPAQLEAILAEVEGARPNFRIILDRKVGVEEIELLVEFLPGLSTDTPGTVLAAEDRIVQRVAGATGLTPRVRLVESATLERLAGDAAGAVIDKRT